MRVKTLPLAPRTVNPIRREIAENASLVKRPSTDSGHPEPVEGRISCVQGMFNA